MFLVDHTFLGKNSAKTAPRLVPFSGSVEIPKLVSPIFQYMELSSPPHPSIPLGLYINVISVLKKCQMSKFYNSCTLSYQILLIPATFLPLLPFFSLLILQRNRESYNFGNLKLCRYCRVNYIKLYLD